MAKACSHILVTVATLDKRAYKYIPEKHLGLHSGFNKLLSTVRPIPAFPDQIYMHREDFVGFAGVTFFASSSEELRCDRCHEMFRILREHRFILQLETPCGFFKCQRLC